MITETNFWQLGMSKTWWFLQELLEENGPNRKKLAVCVVSVAEGGAGTEKEDNKVTNGPSSISINDVTVFKSRHEMYPLVQPYINITRKGNKCKLWYLFISV